MRVYADHAATTKLCDAALNAMLPYFQTTYGNPSSIHAVGREAAQALQTARETVARCLGAEPQEIYFTSGGTEADNWAITAAAFAGAKKGKKHLVSTKFEHHAVLHTLQKLEMQGFEVTLVDVCKNGIVAPETIARVIREDTALVTVMFANNEVGTIQPIREIGTLCRERGIWFHTDAVQAVGHIPVDVKEQNITMLSLSAHKFHGPKGVGVLYCRRGFPLTALLEGGGQERGKRAGTENIPGIVGMAAALEEACMHLRENGAYVTMLRERLLNGLLQIPFTHLNGDREMRLPGNVNICFGGIEGEALLLMLDIQGICGSSGSACTSGSLDPSHVLLALGLPHEVAHGSLRLSLGEYNTPEEIAYILETLPPIVERLREMSPLWERIQKGGEEAWLTAKK